MLLCFMLFQYEASFCMFIRNKASVIPSEVHITFTAGQGMPDTEPTSIVRYLLVYCLHVPSQQLSAVHLLTLQCELQDQDQTARHCLQYPVGHYLK